MHKVIVSVGLSKLTIPQKIEHGRVVVTSMTGNLNFETPSPTLAVITTAVDALEAAYIAARTGSRDETAAMHAKEQVFDSALKALGAYVELAASIDAANAETIVLSSGFGVKRASPMRANGFRLKAGEHPGEIQLRTDADPRAVFTWAMTATPADEATWATIHSSTRSQYLATGLNSGTRYYFRVAKTGKDGQEPWSNVLDIVAA